MPILQADQNDIPFLVALVNSAYRGESSRQGWTSEADLFEGNKRTGEATVTELMKNPGAVFLKYVNDDDEIEACVFLKKKGSGIYLGMFSVSPKAQGKGLGKKLLAAADDYAKEQQCRSIYMTVITVREELIAWYEKNGYRKTGQVLPFPTDEQSGIPKQPLEMLVLEKQV